jgi:hypothetical protein
VPVVTARRGWCGWLWLLLHVVLSLREHMLYFFSVISACHQLLTIGLRGRSLLFSCLCTCAPGSRPFMDCLFAETVSSARAHFLRVSSPGWILRRCWFQRAF